MLKQISFAINGKELKGMLVVNALHLALYLILYTFYGISLFSPGCTNKYTIKSMLLT